ncbi:hypothetical protein NIES4071_14490 [Calothrix sp. NIES-4071]|nr:hypothetical protein NIES4071_14490 [Calothrix sp. NIES-4071]BAZ55786.1 hypothetical protein NIES4105_14440 [Calothrix sp. NIES-4105]
MTESISSDTNVEITRNQYLVDLVAAEDVSNGEVGCGQLASNDFLAYLNNRCINIDDESFRSLLSSHLGDILTERDFDSIISKVSRYIESLVASAATVSVTSALTQTEIIEHIPTSKLQQLLETLTEFLQPGTQPTDNFLNL